MSGEWRVYYPHCSEGISNIFGWIGWGIAPCFIIHYHLKLVWNSWSNIQIEGFFRQFELHSRLKLLLMYILHITYYYVAYKREHAIGMCIAISSNLSTKMSWFWVLSATCNAQTNWIQSEKGPHIHIKLRFSVLKGQISVQLITPNEMNVVVFQFLYWILEFATSMVTCSTIKVTKKKSHYFWISHDNRCHEWKFEKIGMGVWKFITLVFGAAHI